MVTRASACGHAGLTGPGCRRITVVLSLDLDPPGPAAAAGGGSGGESGLGLCPRSFEKAVMVVK